MLEVGLEEPVEVENGDARAPRVLSATLTGRTHFRRPIFPNEQWCQLRDRVPLAVGQQDAVDPFDGYVIRARRVARVSVRAGW